MDPKLLQILKKAKEVDQRAKQYDSVDKSDLERNLSSKVSNRTPSISEHVNKQTPITEQTNTNVPKHKIDVNSPEYKQRVIGSKLPPEIQRVMLENPIQQPDAPGTFSMDEEMIKQINPNYGQQTINEERPTPTQNKVIEETTQSISEESIRKMITEEISKALPTIVENYFDKRIIKENIEVLKALKVKRRTTNNKR